jgi:chorismate mutase
MAEPTDVRTQVEELREAIDDLDARIIDLLAQRTRLSGQIQQIRVSSGGPRMVLRREMDILARYREGLGADGTQIAMNVLHLCRGEAR